jgi:hypothetical protein
MCGDGSASPDAAHRIWAVPLVRGFALFNFFDGSRAVPIGFELKDQAEPERGAQPIISSFQPARQSLRRTSGGKAVRSLGIGLTLKLSRNQLLRVAAGTPRKFSKSHY